MSSSDKRSSAEYAPVEEDEGDGNQEDTSTPFSRLSRLWDWDIVSPRPHLGASASDEEENEKKALKKRSHSDWDNHISLLDSAGVASEIDAVGGFYTHRSYQSLLDDPNHLTFRSHASKGEDTGRVSQPSEYSSIYYTPDDQDADFLTVDWAYYAEKDRERKRKVEKLNQELPEGQQVLARAWDGLQTWIALLLIGFFTGAVAAVVGIGVDLFTDLRFGFCEGRGFWISREMCCKEVRVGAACENWRDWHSMLSNVSSGGRRWIEFGSYSLVSVLQASFAAWLCVTFAPYAAGSGISEIKVVLGGFVIKKLLGGWTLIVKSMGLMLAVGAGMMVGKEGPCVHLGCCMANLISRLFSKYRGNEGKKRELMSSAAAAGVAVAFGAPVGGVLFSLEEVSSYFPPHIMWRSIFCAIVAAMSLNQLYPLPFGKHVMFEVTFHHEWQLLEIVPFALVGALGGLIGAFFVRCNTQICAARKTSAIKRWPITETAFVCLLTSAIDYPVVYLQGSNISLLHTLFSDCRRMSGAHEICSLPNAVSIVIALMLCAAIKLILTLFTLGLKIPGGIFVPSLTIGALMGRAVGFALEALHRHLGDVGVFQDCSHTSTCVNPAIYSIVGAAAVLAGVTRMTVSLVVIMIEVTNGMQYVLPVMIGIIISKWVADAFGDESIYIEHIRLNGLPLLDSKADVIFDEHEAASDAMVSRDLQVLTQAGETLRSVQELLHRTTFKGFPVVTSREDMIVVGYIRREILLRVIDKASQTGELTSDTPCVFSREQRELEEEDEQQDFLDFSNFMERSPNLVFHTAPIASVVEMVRGLGLRYLLVTEGGRLVGIIKKKDLLEHMEYHRKLTKLRTEESS